MLESVPGTNRIVTELLITQPVLSNKGKVSCSRKQQMPLMGLEPRPPHYESDLQPTAPRRLDITELTFKLESHFIK